MATRRTGPKKPRRRPGLVGIYPRLLASGWHWFAAIKVEGRLIKGRCRRTQDEAHADFLAMKRKHAQLSELDGITLQDAYDRHCARLLANGGSPVTEKMYRVRFKKWGEILSAGALVHEITVEDIEEFKRRRRTQHGCGPNTVANDLTILARALKVAGLADHENPARLAERPMREDPERPILELPKVRKIADRIRESGRPAAEMHADLVLFLALTGARGSEFCRVTAEDIEVTEIRRAGPGGTETVEPLALVRLRGRKGTRKATRLVPIGGPFVEVAARMKLRTASGPLLKPHGVTTILRRWGERLKEPRLSARVLRRTYGTGAAEDAPLHVVSKLMGHRQITTTQLYLGLAQERAPGVAAKIAQRLLGE